MQEWDYISAAIIYGAMAVFLGMATVVMYRVQEWGYFAQGAFVTSICVVATILMVRESWEKEVFLHSHRR